MKRTFVHEESENDTGNNYRSCGECSVQHNNGFSEEKKMSGSAKHWALKEYKQRGEHLKRKEDTYNTYNTLDALEMRWRGEKDEID